MQFSNMFIAWSIAPVLDARSARSLNASTLLGSSDKILLYIFSASPRFPFCT